LDLLLPFQEFVNKYSLGAVVPLIWKFTQGIGDLLTIPTIYVMKLLGLALAGELTTGFLTTGDNSAIYEAITSYLGSNVLLNSSVLDIERSTSGIHIIVSTPQGLVLVESKKLVICIQPTMDNLSSLRLTPQEQSLFSQFSYAQYFAGILKNTGIPSNTSLSGYDPSQPFKVPAQPAIYLIQQSQVEGLMPVFYGTTAPVSDAEIESAILDAVKGVQVPGKVASNPEFVVSSDHQPFVLRVSSDVIAGGFYNALNALQGSENTWWISATFQCHDSSLIWEFAETLLPTIATA